MRSGVTFEGVGKRFGDVHAVKNLNLEVNDGEFLVLVGPSGCGKTTALRMVAGLESPTEGKISIDGRDVTWAEPRDRDIAMVFQNYALYPHMTVRDNLAFGLKQRKTPKDEIAIRVAEASRMLGLEPFLQRRPRELSGGQRQRVALGRAIVRRPSVFLMDEPLSNLDARLRVNTRGELSDLHRKLATTFIYVTHDQTEAMTMGTRIAVMSDGELQQLDTPQRLYDVPANTFVASFIGSPGMNLLEGRIVHLGESMVFAAPGLSLNLPPHLAVTSAEGTDVFLGIRPEHFRREPVSGENGIRGEVRLREPVGSDTFVTIAIEGASVVARLSPECQPGLGETVTLLPELANVHLFSRETGKRLV